MMQCLEDKILFLIYEGESDSAQRSHMESCRSCAQRYDRLATEMALIKDTLQKAPPATNLASIRMPILYRFLPVAAALLLGIALIWSEKWLWNPIASSPTEAAFNGDLSRFLDQVNEALFSNATGRDTQVNPPDSDVAFVQAALGQDCSDECRELFSGIAKQPSAVASDRH